ncbi:MULTISPECIES: 3-isopropylmalate dehydratase small subunit [unclassified Brevundimonas]|uniref:3-isopropylmalate dehydratase small subunit n=1 Tax=unclassified Brevundimonas TaxID=2622653 RepID=UPI000CFAE5B9|nr:MULTISPECIES: 3-isopropylmalate dehydratase small subunit [unclassified Brevundimonas]PRA29142.1 3-isopropylmalate dehydratase small subunit [Brevundimonas sp. MYb27]PQZ84810.1 3-isopropylmalate dehydratase small subunit [Brevundimonas sp. MYb31]PRB14598.1 3-isopropylmalate dehydratase small subunit [Brevundimonas sp. MYb52]PRB36629.1 3-isopropylmalate dehydratase small subunit [Brevundimonas sp. MYb46]PRB55672.1 3-isopropylmalate dehydratase small subunit [Brevundimonas sp. MYb33]
MRAFTTLDAVAAALPIANIDTDKLVPGRFLKGVTRAGLGRILLHPLRFDADDQPRADFVLNQPPWDQAGILIALDNFGCGSSREHAPWALLDFGIRCVIAPSFADIFRNNCLKNGILPLVLPAADCLALMDLARDPATARFSVSLPDQTVTAGGRVWSFDIGAADKTKLLEGQDEIDLALARLPEIERFEARIGYAAPHLGAF